MHLAVEFPSVAYRWGENAVTDLARAVEEAGYDAIDMFDHVTMGHPKDGRAQGPSARLGTPLNLFASTRVLAR